MSIVLAVFYTSDVAQTALTLDNAAPLAKVMRAVHAYAQQVRADSYQLLRLNLDTKPTPISHRYILEQRP